MELLPATFPAVAIIRTIPLHITLSRLSSLYTLASLKWARIAPKAGKDVILARLPGPFKCVYYARVCMFECPVTLYVVNYYIIRLPCCWPPYEILLAHGVHFTYIEIWVCMCVFI